MDRVEYMIARVHDFCDDGDETVNRQNQERRSHIAKGEQLLKILEGLAELVRRDLNRFGWQGNVQQDVPRVVRQGPREATNG
jgi:hypothetical protein